MFQPVATSSVMGGGARLAGRREVVEHDRPAHRHPSSGWVQRRVVSWFLALASAVEHQQVEGPVLPQLCSVAAKHANVGMVSKQGGRRRRPGSVALDAHERGRRVGCPDHPRQPDSAPGPRLTDPPTCEAPGEDRQQPTLLGRAGMIESLARRHRNRSTNQRREIGNVRVCTVAADRHAIQYCRSWWSRCADICTMGQTLPDAALALTTSLRQLAILMSRQ